MLRIAVTVIVMALLTLNADTYWHGSASGSVPFTALHTYYMSPTGSDSNNGLTTGTAWLSPNHAVVCGDVIIAAAGSYNASVATAGSYTGGVVSNCPSSSGGIDGTGGVYFAVVLCGGSFVGACTFTGNSDFTLLTNNNWAFEGWQVSGIGSAHTAFEPVACTSGVTLHHFAFINDITFNAGEAYGTNNCGMSGAGLTSPGSDYVAVIGNIAQNANQNGVCLAAIDAVGTARWDAVAGTHIYFYGNFAWNDIAVCATDVEHFMVDTLDGNGFQGGAVVANNIGWHSERMGIQVYDQNMNSNTPTVKVYNNTMFDNFHDTGGTPGSVAGDINLQNGAGSPWLWTVSVFNNISKTTFTTNESGEYIYAMQVTGANVAVGGTGIENVLNAEQTMCAGAACDAGFNIVTYSGATIGTNLYEDPLFTNTTDLLANRMGAPSCGAFTNVTACMGWNANTRTLTTPSVISDLTPTASGTAGKGYQLPSITCAANADYPVWLKGIVYLQWDGSKLTEHSDLVTKPCGM